MRWVDPLYYTLAPRGSFEGGTAGWTLAGARVAYGNEPFQVAGSGSWSLSIAAGGSATSAVMCASTDKPTLRFFAKSSSLSLLSTLKVSVLFEDAAGRVLSAPIGVVPATGRWGPTLPMLVGGNLLSLLGDGRTPVVFRFQPVGASSWTIDDVYVDPRRH
jgi:hypothetical protein